MQYTQLINPIVYKTLLARIVSNINPEYSFADYPLWFGYFDNGAQSSLCVVCGVTYTGDCYMVLGNCPKVVPTNEVFPAGRHQAAQTLMSLAPEVVDVRYAEHLADVPESTITKLNMRYPHLRSARFLETEAERCKEELATAKFYLEEAKADFKTLGDLLKGMFKADDQGVYVKVAGGTYSKLSRADAENVRKFL